MKEEYSSNECAVCAAPADGIHYGAISCRSCNAFFRRTVVEKAVYRCKHRNNCIIDPDGRCACRACRFSKCIDAGMKISAVQPKRDPTGSQKERRKRNSNNRSQESPDETINNNCPAERISSGSFIIDAIKTEYDFTTPRTCSSNWNISPERLDEDIKIELDEDAEPEEGICGLEKISRLNTPTDDEQREFRNLVCSFSDHQRMMKLSFATSESFLDEYKNGIQLRRMEPTDVNKLSAVELAGLLFWIEKLYPYTELPHDDKTMLLKRYSVRKLSLDHFYSASKHPENCARGEFVMNNYTFVPPDRTGFELPDEDIQQTEAKRETFAPTFARFWSNVIFPFAKMGVSDAEVVFLHLMLLWSTRNNEYVSVSTRDIMKQRRDWAMNRLFEWYHDNNFKDPGVRFGQMTFILGEIETICDMHCQDFQVAKLFEFCDMSKFWYESVCYDQCNTNTVKFDPYLIDSLKTFNAMGVIERHYAKPPIKQRENKGYNPNEAWDRLNSFRPREMGIEAAGSQSQRFPNAPNKRSSRRRRTVPKEVISENHRAHRNDRKYDSIGIVDFDFPDELNNTLNGPLGLHNDNGNYYENDIYVSNGHVL